MKTTEKEELLGVVEDSMSGDIQEPDLEILKQFENPKSVISAFCTQCRTYHELDFNEAEKVFTSLKQPLEFENKYLIFNSCSLCKGDDKTIFLKTF